MIYDLIAGLPSWGQTALGLVVLLASGVVAVSETTIASAAGGIMGLGGMGLAIWKMVGDAKIEQEQTTRYTAIIEAHERTNAVLVAENAALRAELKETRD